MQVFSSLVLLLAQVAIVALTATVLVAVLRTHQKAYFAGLAAGVAAYVAYTIGLYMLGLVGVTSLWLGLVVIIPAVEETARLVFGLRAREVLTAPYQWLSFGAGYAVFEGAMKLTRASLDAVSSGWTLDLLAPPFVAMVGLVFIGVVAAVLIHRGWRWWQILPVTFAIHAAHNWFALTFHVEAKVVESLLLRIAVFAALTIVLLILAARSAQVTKPPPRVSTPL